MGPGQLFKLPSVLHDTVGWVRGQALGQLKSVSLILRVSVRNKRKKKNERSWLTHVRLEKGHRMEVMESV